MAKTIVQIDASKEGKQFVIDHVDEIALKLNEHFSPGEIFAKLEATVAMMRSLDVDSSFLEQFREMITIDLKELFPDYNADVITVIVIIVLTRLTEMINKQPEVFNEMLDKYGFKIRQAVAGSLNKDGTIDVKVAGKVLVKDEELGDEYKENNEQKNEGDSKNRLE